MNKLLIASYELIHVGHSIIVIEYNLGVIKCADFFIDMGHESGNVVFAGTQEEMVRDKKNHSERFFKEEL
ncbi:MAG: hypothetical protein HRT58_06710 [Crocinitomicaceae bacterium]|nr:hypothetical protein [Flavobacteriales bacterium]NQZ35337.1 hypothetical protein [Crocinitomicaceae bacterium]